MANKKKTIKKKAKVKAKAKKPKEIATPMPERVHPASLVSDLKGMKNPGAYVTLIQYIALPREYRTSTIGVDTQEKLAKMLGVNVATLSQWKSHPGFWNDVENVQIKYFTERVGDVVLAQENKALKGDTPAARTVLEVVGRLKKRDEKESEVPQLLAEAIKNISTILDK